MSKLNASDIQGFSLRGYNMPFARYLFLRLTHAERARTLLTRLLPLVTTGQLWDRKPESTINLAFTSPNSISEESVGDILCKFVSLDVLGMLITPAPDSSGNRDKNSSTIAVDSCEDN